MFETKLNIKGRLNICPEILSYDMFDLRPRRFCRLATIDIIPTENIEDTIQEVPGKNRQIGFYIKKYVNNNELFAVSFLNQGKWSERKTLNYYNNMKLIHWYERNLNFSLRLMLLNCLFNGGHEFGQKLIFRL